MGVGTLRNDLETVMRSMLNEIVHGAESSSARDSAGSLSDAELMRRFIGVRDQAAFSLIVRRHGPLV